MSGRAFDSEYGSKDFFDVLVGFSISTYAVYFISVTLLINETLNTVLRYCGWCKLCCEARPRIEGFHLFLILQISVKPGYVTSMLLLSERASWNEKEDVI